MFISLESLSAEDSRAVEEMRTKSKLAVEHSRIILQFVISTVAAHKTLKSEKQNNEIDGDTYAASVMISLLLIVCVVL